MLGRADETCYTDRAVIGVTDGNLHIDSYQGKDLYFNYYTNGELGSFSKALIISGLSGNVGIGVNPAYKLDVAGVIRSDGIVIGDAMLVWDAENKAVKVVGKDGNTAVNFYAVNSVAALEIADL